MSTNIQRSYKFTQDMAAALRKYCRENAVNEAAFVRLAVAEKLAKQDVKVTHVLKHGGRRVAQDKPEPKSENEPERVNIMGQWFNRS